MNDQDTNYRDLNDQVTINNPMPNSLAKIGTDTARTPLGHRVRRGLAMLLLAVTATMGVTTIVDQTAAAAEYNAARVCIQGYNGGASGAYALGNVTVQYWVDGYRWLSVSTVKTDPYGCVTVGVVPGYYVQFYVNNLYYGTRYTGTSEYRFVYSTVVKTYYPTMYVRAS